jgi:hypothetical protein
MLAVLFYRRLLNVLENRKEGPSSVESNQQPSSGYVLICWNEGTPSRWNSIALGCDLPSPI